MAIDTLKVARRLRDAGFSETQAEAVVAAVQEGTEGAELATKADLAVLNAELRTEIESVKAAIEAAKSETLYRMFQMVLGAVLVNFVTMLGVMFAFAKLLGH
jgi:hypothetical protein